MCTQPCLNFLRLQNRIWKISSNIFLRLITKDNLIICRIFEYAFIFVVHIIFINSLVELKSIYIWQQRTRPKSASLAQSTNWLKDNLIIFNNWLRRTLLWSCSYLDVTVMIASDLHNKQIFYIIMHYRHDCKQSA